MARCSHCKRDIPEKWGCLGPYPDGHVLTVDGDFVCDDTCWRGWHEAVNAEFGGSYVPPPPRPVAEY